MALENLDEVIQAIRGAQSADDARDELMKPPFKMSDRQAQAVLDMQLRRLARLERQKIEEEFAAIIQQIAYLEDLLANPRKIDYLIREDAQDVKKKYGDSRRTQISRPGDRGVLWRKTSSRTRRSWSPSATAATSSVCPLRPTGCNVAVAGGSPAW